MTKRKKEKEVAGPSAPENQFESEILSIVRRIENHAMAILDVAEMSFEKIKSIDDSINLIAREIKRRSDQKG